MARNAFLSLFFPFLPLPLLLLFHFFLSAGDCCWGSFLICCCYLSAGVGQSAREQVDAVSELAADVNTNPGRRHRLFFPSPSTATIESAIKGNRFVYCVVTESQ